MLIDLHAHSTASDGTDSPAELVAAAAASGLDVVAITDHDTTDGWAAAVAALPAGLRLIRGAEFSCVASDGRGGQLSVHLLGYLFDPVAAAIVTEQTRLRDERHSRLRSMAEKMAADGFPVDPEAVFAQLPAQAQPGRPHLAKALVAAGVVDSVGDAFHRYLVPGSPYYVERADTELTQAVRMIRAAGGVPVLAHAFARSRGPVLEPEVIAGLAAEGLAGVEVDHPDHSDEDRTTLHTLATELDLVITGSSDYHGTNKTVRLGQERTDPRMLERIEELAAPHGIAAVPG